MPDTDEIDLLHLLARITRFLIKNWWVFAIGIAVSMTASWFSYRKSSPVYSSEMMVQSRFLTETFASQVLTGLTKRINAGDSSAAAALQLSNAEAAQIAGIRVASPFSEKVNMNEENKVTFIIQAEVSNPKILQKLQSGIVHFFENFDFIRVRVDEQRKSFRILIERIDREIGRADSMPDNDVKGSLYPLFPLERKPADRRNPILNPAIFDPSTMSVYMTNQRNDARERLATLHNGIEVMQGFSPATTPSRPQISIYLASGFSGGILLSLLLLGLRSAQWLLKKYPD